MMDDRCGCEHQDHFNFRVDGNGVIDRPRGLHEYLAKESGDQWALYVGHVCDYCAATCMKDWIVEEHVCGTGDCRKAS